MARYQLQKKCFFVDAYKPKKPDDDDYSIKKRKPDKIPHAHVMKVKQGDGSQGDADYLTLNDMAGFIARFIIQGVDTDELLPQIIKSEYGISLDQAKQDVKDVVKLLEGFIRSRVHQRHRQPPASLGTGVGDGEYDLNFSTNFFGAGFLKGPL